MNIIKRTEKQEDIGCGVCTSGKCLCRKDTHSDNINTRRQTLPVFPPSFNFDFSLPALGRFRIDSVETEPIPPVSHSLTLPITHTHTHGHRPDVFVLHLAQLLYSHMLKQTTPRGKSHQFFPWSCCARFIYDSTPNRPKGRKRPTHTSSVRVIPSTYVDQRKQTKQTLNTTHKTFKAR